MTNNKYFHLGTLGFALWLLAGTSYAALYAFDLTTGGTTSTPSTICGTVACQMTWNLDSSTRLTAVAYSTTTNYAPNGYITTTGGAYNAGYTNCTGTCGANGNFASARIFQYSGGIGISNNIETAGQTNYDGVNGGTTVAPQHAMDNNGAIDLAVFSMQKLIGGSWVNQTFDPTSFKLGYVNNDSDVQAWAGGSGLAANYDFRNVCFQGCTTGTALTSLPGTQDFVEITNTVSTTNTPTTSGDGANIALDTTEYFTGTTVPSAQYLVMSGNLGLGSISGGNDFFKISSISMKVPVPASAYLLGLGLMVLAFTRRPLRCTRARA